MYFAETTPLETSNDVRYRGIDIAGTEHHNHIALAPMLGDGFGEAINWPGIMRLGTLLAHTVHEITSANGRHDLIRLASPIDLCNKRHICACQGKRECIKQ